MSIGQLSFIPYSGASFMMTLFERNDQQAAIESSIPSCKTDKGVFQDYSYRFEFICEKWDSIQSLSFYVNDDLAACNFNADTDNKVIKIGFSDITNRVFLDCFGFTQITIKIHFNDDTTAEYITPYIPVLVKRGDLNESVRKMVEYVNDYRSYLLLHDKQKSRDLADMKENGFQSLESHINLAIDIANLYEKLYSYFKINSRSHIEKTPIVDRIEKLQTITPKTMEYIVSHPEHLKTTSGTFGVQIGDRFYEPQKTMVLESRFSLDLYENRVVLGFLKKMYEEVERMYCQCEERLDRLPENDNYNDKYANSSYYMCALTQKRLQDNMLVLSNLKNRFQNMWNLYRGIMHISPDTLIPRPHPTRIFMSVPQYNQVFTCIQQWFYYGIYDFSAENYMLSLIKISSLYEVYLFIKFILYFEDRGFVLKERIRNGYPVKQNWKYKNVNIDNTIVLSRNQVELTLFYQPVIFDYSRDRKGIELYKNNTLPANANKDEGGHYYSPDFIVKITSNGNSKYLILDAKFSNLETVKKHQIQDLTFKYLFSISVLEEKDDLLGLCVIYGKCSSGEELITAYDKQLPGHKIHPIVEFLPLIEGIDTESHFAKLDQLFANYLN